MTVVATREDRTANVVQFGDRAAARAPHIQPKMDIRHVILDVCASHPAQANGVFNVAKQLAHEQKQMGDSASLIFLCSPDERAEAEAEGVPTTICPVVGGSIKGRPIRLPHAVLEALTNGAGRDTVYHIHGGRNPLLILVARALEKRNLPFAVTVHGRYSHVLDGNQNVARRVPALYLRWIESRALNKARFVHAVSPLERDILHRLAPRARIEFIPNAAYSSTTDGPKRAPERTQPSDDFPLFGFCGRLEIEHKGLDLLVEGFARYASTGGKGKLVIFGTGPAISNIAAMIDELGMSDRIELHGPRFGEEKFRTLRGWDFFIMPSRFDGMPIAALEAALHGLPLIMSPATGLGDLISEFGAGDMIQPLTCEGVADAMRRAADMSADQWRRQCLNAHRMAAGFDWRSVAEELRVLYAGPRDTPRLSTSAPVPPKIAANRA